MFGLEVGFDRPWYLLLLGLLPLLWVFSFKSLSGLGRIRRLTAIGLRTAVSLLIVLALAEIQLLRTSEKMTVIYLLDQSESIPRVKRLAMMDYVIKDVRRHRRADREDRAGVIVFGADAKIEIPPFDDDLPSIGDVESYLDLRTDATNLAAALKLAQASFPEDTARRIVIVTDGNENLGDARSVARTLTNEGIAIDVVPIPLGAQAEIDVEKLTLPSDIRKGQTFEGQIVINNYSETNPTSAGGTVSGKVRLTQQIGREETLINEVSVTLKPGKNVFGFKHQIDQSAMFTYKAVFTPDEPLHDGLSQNNQATAYTHVRGKGHVLLIEDWEDKGEFDFMVSRLRAQDLEVAVQTTDELFTSAVELLQYDAIVLANVPRSSGDPSSQVTSFSDEQIDMLVRNTQQMGCGLVMLGGLNSFGAGGWANTELEKAMPVDFQIKNAKIQAVGALVLMMHASEMAQGNYWQKVVAVEAIKALGPMDYCGLLHWDNMTGKDDWLWAKPVGLVRVANRRNTMLARLDRMSPGDMPEFDPSMKKALVAFNRVNASIKHMIVISDGDPSPPSFRSINDFVRSNIQITTVAVGAHGWTGHNTLRNIASATGGKYYVVTNPRALPSIYQREARRVARPLIFEPEGGVKPIVTYPHEMLGNIDRDSLRLLKGYVMTTIKENPLVEQAIVADKPDDGGTNSTILASWNYGLGRAVAFTSDAGRRWADAWTSAEYYDKFFGDMIRWSMRPIKSDANFSVATEVQDGKIRLVVTALDKEDEFLNFLNITAEAIGPDLKPLGVRLRQTAPGRYVGQFDAAQPGSYVYSVMPGSEYNAIRGGVNVPFSSELRDRETNEGLLQTLVSLKPQGGKAGTMIRGELARDNVDELLQTDTFRHNLAKAISSQDVWPLAVVVCATIFFADVFVRRVHVGFAWLVPLWARVSLVVLRREREALPDERLSRLRSQKAAIRQNLEGRRGAARFDPQPDADVAGDPTGRALQNALLDAAAKTTSAAPQTSASRVAPEVNEEEESYTARLLRTKKKVFKERENH